MKKKIIIACSCLSVLVICTGVYLALYYNNIQADQKGTNVYHFDNCIDKIDHIVVTDGSNGNNVEIKDQDTINKFKDIIRGVKLNALPDEEITMGWLHDITAYSKDDTELFDFCTQGDKFYLRNVGYYSVTTEFRDKIKEFSFKALGE